MFEFVYSIQNILKDMQKFDEILKLAKFKMLFYVFVMYCECYVMFVFRKNDVTCEHEHERNSNVRNVFRSNFTYRYRDYNFSNFL